MKFYKDKNGEIYHCSDEAVSALRNQGAELTEISEQEYEEIQKPSISDAINMKIDELKYKFGLACEKDIEHEGFIFQADKKSVDAIIRNMLHGGYIKWYDVDNVPREIQLKDLFGAISERGRKLFELMQEYKKKISLTKDVDDVLAMSFDGLFEE